jgi:hypothetical protein
MSRTDLRYDTPRALAAIKENGVTVSQFLADHRSKLLPETIVDLEKLIFEEQAQSVNVVAEQEPEMPAAIVEEQTTSAASVSPAIAPATTVVAEPLSNTAVTPPPSAPVIVVAAVPPVTAVKPKQHAKWLLDAAARIKDEEKSQDARMKKIFEEETAKGRGGLAFIPDNERKYKLWRAPFAHSPEFKEHPEEFEVLARHMDQKQNERFTALVEAHLKKHGKLPRNVTRWNDAPPPASSFVLPMKKEDLEEILDLIPPFDPSVMSGIYKRFVEVATRGTTMVPQFVYAIAKTVVGARMAGKVTFENLDVEPRFYTALIGETGSGKGEAWRRVLQILTCDSQIGNVAGLKIINSADSGAGIKDAFFDPPEDAPMLMYVDEIEGFGNKAAATRNPAILDTLIELADSTSISRVKVAKKGGKASKTKNNARLCAVLCGQDGHVYMKALAGRTKLGLWDRLTPEYSFVVEAGDLPRISTADAIQVLNDLLKLDYSGVMTMAPSAKTLVDEFWSQQTPETKKKARWKKSLTLDVYMNAFGRGVKVAELEDVESAIKTFTRQLVIRQIHFTTEVPDRTGYYQSLIKTITQKMERQIKAGVSPALVAKSRRDYEKETHAHRDNEAHLFDRAWNIYAPVWLTRFDVKKANGQIYLKYLPVIEDE